MIVSVLDQVVCLMVSREAGGQDVVNQNTIKIEYEVKAAIVKAIWLGNAPSNSRTKQSEATLIFFLVN